MIRYFIVETDHICYFIVDKQIVYSALSNCKLSSDLCLEENNTNISLVMLRVLKRESSITFHIYFYSTLLCKKFIARYYSFISRYCVRNSTCACDWTRYKPIKLGRTDSNQNSWFCFMQLKTSIWFVFLLFGRERHKHIIGDIACFNERIFNCFPDVFQGLFFKSGSVVVKCYICGVLRFLYRDTTVMLHSGQKLPPIYRQREFPPHQFSYIGFASSFQLLYCYFAIEFCWLGVAFNSFFVGRFWWVFTTAGGPFGRVPMCMPSFARGSRFHWLKATDWRPLIEVQGSTLNPNIHRLITQYNGNTKNAYILKMLKPVYTYEQYKIEIKIWTARIEDKIGTRTRNEMLPRYHIHMIVL